MKTLFKSIIAFAAAAIAFASCVKEEGAPVAETKTVQFFAESIETKTAFGTPDGTTYPTLWTANDKSVKLFLNLNEEFAADVTVSDDFKTASFNTEVKLADNDPSAAPYTFYAMSPASAYIGKTAERYSATIPTSQKPLENSVDEAAQILYAVSDEFEEIPNTVTLNFKHFTAYGKLSFVNLNLGDAKVTSIAISSTDVKLAGRWNYVVADGTFTENSGATEITLDTDKTENLWFACAPVGSMNGKKLKFTVNTDKGPLSKEVTLSGDKYNFTAGRIANMKVNMEGITFAESKVYELVTDAADLTVDSKIIIVAKDYDYALSTTQNGNNRGQAAVTKVDNKIENPGEGVQVLTVGEGYAEGTLSFSTGQQYLYAPGGGNYLRSTTTLNDNASWTVTIADGVATIKANRSGKNWMRYNSTSSIFSCYDSDQKDIVIYKLQGSGTVKENYLEVSTNAIEVGADETIASFTVSSDLVWTASSDNATVSTEDNTVNVSFAANEDTEEQTYTVTVSADGVESQVVTITQAAKAAEGGESGWISTPFANLKEGDQVVIVSTKDTDTWAMSNDNSTGSAPAGVTGVTYANGKLTVEPAANIIWYVGVDGNNRIFYNDSGKDTWLYCTGTNNGVRVGTNTAKAFTFESNYLKHDGTGRYVGVYTTNPDWRCYTSINTNIQGQTFQFFVKAGEGGGETPEPDPSTPVELVMSKVTCSAQTETSLTFSWAAVEGATSYQVYFDSVDKGTVITTSYTASDLTAGTSHTIEVKAVGDGVNYTTSASAETCTASTISTSQGGGETTGGYTLVTNLSDITTGQYVIAAKVDGTYYAMSNTFASKIDGANVTVTDNTISESDAQSYVVSITKDGVNYYISSGTNYLKYNSSTNLGTQSNQYSWEIAAGTNGTFRINATTGTNRAIMYQISGARFGGYSTTNTSGYADIELFKKN